MDIEKFITFKKQHENLNKQHKILLAYHSNTLRQNLSDEDYDITMEFINKLHEIYNTYFERIEMMQKESETID